jgi:hypothetical protein
MPQSPSSPALRASVHHKAFGIVVGGMAKQHMGHALGCLAQSPISR